MEIWKDVVDYEGIYEVSNRGNLRSVDRVIYRSTTGKAVRYKGQRLQIWYNIRNNYYEVGLSVNRRRKNCKIH